MRRSRLLYVLTVTSPVLVALKVQHDDDHSATTLPSHSIDELGEALYFAVMLNNTVRAKRLLRDGAPLYGGQADLYHMSAIHIAAFKGFAHMIPLLVQHGVDVDVTADGGFTALIYAALKGHIETIEALAAAGAHIDAHGNYCHPDPISSSDLCDVNSLHIAAYRGDTATVRVLLAAGASLEARDGDKNATALHWAAWQDQVEVVQVLLDAGSDIEARDREDITPLMYATHSKKYESFKYESFNLLIRAGAKLKPKVDPAFGDRGIWKGLVGLVGRNMTVLNVLRRQNDTVAVEAVLKAFKERGYMEHGWSNAMTYNQDESFIYKTAADLKVYADRKMAPLSAMARESSDVPHELTFEMKKQLNENAALLSSKDLYGMVGIVEDTCKRAIDQSSPQEVEIDIDSLDLNTFLKVELGHPSPLFIEPPPFAGPSG